MIGYVVRRIMLGAFTAWLVTVLSFVIIQLPEGDAVDRHLDVLMAGGDQTAAGEYEQLRDYLGLDDPMHIRYGKWVWNMLQGDLGFSMFAPTFEHSPSPHTVKEVVGDRIWLTIALTSFTMAVTWIFAIPIGIYSAVRHHSIGDYVFTFLGFSGLAVPDFLLGLVLMYVAFAYFDQSVGGLFSAKYIDQPWSVARVLDVVNHLLIPAIVLGTSGTASLIRILRNNLLDELSKPYVVTARARGVAPWKLIVKYPVRVAINPLVSTAGYLLPALISGSVIVSVVLSLPTLGPVLLKSMIQEDVYLAGFIVMILGILTVIGTLLSDILLAVVDPRIKLAGN